MTIMIDGYSIIIILLHELHYVSMQGFSYLANRSIINYTLLYYSFELFVLN